MKSYKTFILRIAIVLFFVALMVPCTESNKVKAAKKVKEYPVRDKELPTYDYVTAVPDIIYSTYASENGLGGNHYYVNGTVKGVYKGLTKICKALKVKEKNLEKDAVSENITYILVKTKKGYVVIGDLYSNVVEQGYEKIYSGQFSDKEIEEGIEQLKEKFIYYEPYDEYPSKGEKVKIYVTYAGFSDVTKTPMFYYGINQLLTNSSDKEEIDPDKIETSTYKIDNVKMEIPKEWVWPSDTDGIKNFYSEDGFLMVSSMYLEKFSLDQWVVDMYVDSFLESQPGLKLTGTKRNEYKNKDIKEYYICSFKGKVSGNKVKVKLTFFEYKGDMYSVGYCSKLTDDSDVYFQIYTNIIKSIKPVK